MVANLSGPEIIGLLVLFLLILGAKEIPAMLNRKRHRIHEFKQAIREVQQEVAELFESGAVHDDGKAYHLHKLIFWLFAALVIAMGAVALGLL